MDPLLKLSEFLFSYGGYTPHGFCIAWDPVVLWMHVGSDLLVALSYFAIPMLILVFLRRRGDPSLIKPAILFVAFITACGVTHLMGIVTLYLPLYGLQGVLKLTTALISALTAFALWRMLPDALRIPGVAEMAAVQQEVEKREDARRMVEAALSDNRVALAQKLEQLEHTNEELKEFAYAASHDLKAPVNTLGMWLEGFRDDHGDGLSEDARVSLEDASVLITRMQMLVEDVLGFSDVINRYDEPITNVALDAPVQEAMARLAAKIETLKAEIKVEPLPSVEGNIGLLRVLFQNLLSNALKFHRHGERPRIHISSEAGPEAVVIKVRDEGIGIAAQHHERIFEMFRRLHGREDYQGTGLGLSLCRRIVISHGGLISVRSEEGHGAEFRITLPLRQAQPFAAPGGASQAA